MGEELGHQDVEVAEHQANEDKKIRWHLSSSL